MLEKDIENLIASYPEDFSLERGFESGDTILI